MKFNIFLWAIIIFYNFYIAYRYMKLYNEGLINTNRRISIKILNKHIGEAKGNDAKEKIQRLKRIYVPFLILFYSAILLALLSIAF